MSWTKGRLVDKAYGAFGLQGFVFSMTPEMLGEACAILDAMMAAWGTQYGIRIGYNSGNSDTGIPDPKAASGIPDHCNEAVYLGLAERLTDTIGKTLSGAMVRRCQTSFDALLSWCEASNIPQMQYRRNTPSGAGNKPYQQGTAPVFLRPVTQLDTGAGDSFIDGGDGTPLTDGGGDDDGIPF